MGIHLLSIAEPRGHDPGGVTPKEQQHLDALARWFADEGAYEHQQMTRPVTLGNGLSDSPAGLLAWMVEKYWAWSDHGDRDGVGDNVVEVTAGGAVEGAPAG